MTQPASLKERFATWCAALAITSFIPILMMYAPWIPHERHATSAVMVFGIANSIILIVAPATSTHLKSANHRLWLIAGLGFFFVLPSIATILFESIAGTIGFQYLLAGLIALCVLTMFFTLLWWGTEARMIPVSLTFPVAATHTGLLLWCSLTSSDLPFVLYALLAAAAVFSWYRQLLPTKAPS